MQRTALISLLLVWTFMLQGQIDPYDLLITELMIDPTPEVEWPNAEWVELFNNSDQAINLSGLQFSSGTSPKTLPDYDLAPGSYVIVVDDGKIDLFSTVSNKVEIGTFPALTNGGDVATIANADGTIIHELIYEKSWYGDTQKDDGGYTLEMINPLDPCLGQSNWSVTQSDSGGTPGAENSIWGPIAPTGGLQVEEVLVIDATEIQVTFDRLPSAELSELDFELTGGLSVVDLTMGQNVVVLTTSSPLSEGVPYTLTIKGEIRDCSGAMTGMDQAFTVVLPVPVQAGAVVINEVLFNPIGTESDYVEVINTTDQYIDLSTLSIGNLDPDGSGTIRALDQQYILAPDDIVVFTEKKTELLVRYPQAIAEKVIEMDLPSFNNTSGNVTILADIDGVSTTLDAMDYDEDMHFEFIDDADGVSLERVSTMAPSDERNTWQSASSASGYGTPTLPNSQTGGLDTGASIDVSLATKTFYPLGDVVDQSELEIIFQLDRTDYLLTMDVFDRAGRHLNRIANNALVGNRESYFWDGRDAEQRVQNSGVYVIFIRLITLDGRVYTKKLPCVLSRAI